MRTFTPSIIARLLKETASFYFLLELDLVAATTYLTDMDIVYYYDGNPYQPSDMTIDTMNQGGGLQVETMDLTIQNVDQQMASHFLNDNQISRTATIRFACFDRAATDLIDELGNQVLDDEGEEILGPGSAIATLPLFRGLISNWSMDELAIRISLKTEMILWKKRTLRKSNVMCRWSFKGTECGYSGGSTTCDKTYARCAALVNTDNFGGFRYAAKMMETEVQWGPQ